MDVQDLAGKVAVVTGAGSGIGCAAARLLVAHGVRVVLAGRRAERLQALEAELGPEVSLAVPVDVSRAADVAELCRLALHRFGTIDILLANAGQFRQGKVADVDTEALVSIVETNVIGVIRCIKAVLPTMQARGSGDILVTSSISGHRDIENEAVYSASKHAVATLVNLLRNEVAGQGIRVATISPGIVLNELWGVNEASEIAAGLEERRGLRSEDIAEAMLLMLQMPPRVTVRDMVVLPQHQII